jgi:hypothetical protein
MTHVFIFLMVVSDSELLDPFKYVEVGPRATVVTGRSVRGSGGAVVTSLHSGVPCRG